MYLMPLDQICLLSFVSTRTSVVLICFSANFLIALMALGARFLNPLWKVRKAGHIADIHTHTIATEPHDPFIAINNHKVTKPFYECSFTLTP